VLVVELEENTTEHLKWDQYLILPLYYAYNVVGAILYCIYQQPHTYLCPVYWCHPMCQLLWHTVSCTCVQQVEVSSLLMCGTVSLGKILETLPLMMKSSGYLWRSGTNYPVMWHPIPEEEKPQSHCCRCLNLTQLQTVVYHFKYYYTSFFFWYLPTAATMQKQKLYLIM
jgi:hypothetical protein